MESFNEKWNETNCTSTAVYKPRKSPEKDGYGSLRSENWKDGTNKNWN